MIRTRQLSIATGYARHVLRTGLVALLLGVASLASANQPDPARIELDRAIAAMGGEATLESVHSLSFAAIGHRNMLEQSVRPKGPWFEDYFQIEETRDFDHLAERVAQRHRGYSSPEWFLHDHGWSEAPYYPAYVVADGAVAKVEGGRFTAWRGRYLQDVQEDFAFGPVRVLLTARDAPDLHREPDARLHGFVHHVLAFTWNHHPVKLYLSGYTELPEAIEWVGPRPYDVFWNAWGDLTTRVLYGGWSLEHGGLRFPRQWTVERDGLPEYDFSLTSLTLNPQADPSSLRIPEEVRKAFLAQLRTIDELPLGQRGKPATEIEPGVIQIPGAWNVALIRQTDGIVVLEGVISSTYSAKVLDEAHRRFPGVPVKAVITTSDAWPHIGGMREYVARGIPVYALDLDRPVLQRLFAAPHTARPDDLQRHPREPQWHLVGSRTPLGSGENRLELIPCRSETGERQMLVYFPQHRLLYTSDLFSPDGQGGWYTPEYLMELRKVVARERLDVKDIFGMHYELTPWATMSGWLDTFLSGAGARESGPAGAN